jgi:hypothetical protein
MATGLGTRALILSVEGVDYSDAVSSVSLNAADSDSDFLSFAEARAGGSRTYSLAMTLKQDVTSASLWRMIWDNAGDEVAVIIRPNGGTAISGSTPTFAGTAVVAEPDGTVLGGDASKSASARFVVDVAWEFTGKPIMDSTP